VRSQNGDLACSRGRLHYLGLIALIGFSIVSLCSRVRAGDPDPRLTMKTIVARLPQVRKLAFKRNVPLDLETGEQVRQYMSEEMDKYAKKHDLEDDRKVGVMLAMWPRDFLPEKVGMDMETSLLLGFYSHETKRMVVLAGDDTATAQVVDGSGKPLSFPYIDEMTLAHELTHALQDQYFDLSRLGQIKHDDDRELAFRAIVEGDATISGLLYTIKGIHRDQALELLSEIFSISSAVPREMASVPDTLTMPGGFPYGSGARFAYYAYKHGGFAAVDELLQNPPTTTHEILDPEKYFGHPSPPAKIAIHGYEKSLAGWTVIDENTMGELMMIAIIHQNLGDAEDWLPTGNAWRADKFVELGSGDARTMIGFISFADPDNAKHFGETYLKILDDVHGDRVPHLVQTHDKTVLIVIGQPAKDSPGLIPALWSQTKFGPAVPQPKGPLTRVASRSARNSVDALCGYLPVGSAALLQYDRVVRATGSGLTL